tara:strand:+ start:301 stop:795 length:495 start_codon:yes stop_codon:yes gene_type:complete
MFKYFLKNNLSNFITIFIIFFIDRVSKSYVLKLAEQGNELDIYLTKYLNIYLIWNKGIAFGLMSFNSNIIYNFITFLITIICIIILIMIIKSDGIKKYSLITILGGALGNLFDRFYYGAVPDFIDLHLKTFHWFVFNIADIFITVGVFCLIFAELFTQNKENEK